MQFLFDHALAILCGAFLLVGVLTLQTQSRIHSVQETIQGSARSQIGSFADVVSQELDNVLSETQARAMLDSYRCLLERDPTNSFTSRAEVPALIRLSASAPPVPAHLRFTMVASGDSVLTGGAWAKTYRLERAIDTGAGYGPPSTIATGLVDFDMTFRGRAAESASGGPPIRFSQIAVDMAMAHSDLDQDDAALNVARLGLVVRPPNLTSGS